MAQIGSFTRTTDGYTGTITSLTLNVAVTLKPVGSTDVENAPDYRVLGNGTEIGAAWKRTGDKAGDYLSLLIDDPSFARPIRANLFQAGNDSKLFHLLWTRPSKRDDRG